MAITRAQQAKQLLKQGGRTGFFAAGIAAGDKVSPSSSGTKTTNTGNNNDNQSTARERYIRDYVSKGKVKGGGLKKIIDADDGGVKYGYSDKVITGADVKKAKSKYQDQFTSKGLAPPGPNRKKRQRALNYTNKQIAKYLNRFGSYYDPSKFSVTKTGYPNFGFPNIYKGIEEELEAGKELKDILKTGNMIPIGKSGKSVEMSAVPDLDIDSIRELAATQTTMQGAPLTGYQANALKSLKETIEKRDDFLQTGDTSDIYPDPPTPTNTGPDSSADLDPCKGPNPPAYCFTTPEPEPEDPTNTANNFFGLTPRIAGSMFDFSNLADGGRAGMMDGGIMNAEDLDREAFLLGGIAKGLKKAVRGVKKLVKSPIGKAALIGAGFGLAGMGPFKGLFASGKGLGFKNFMTNKLFGTLTAVGHPTEAPVRMGGLFNLIKSNPIPSIFAASALAGLATPKQDDGFNIDQYYADNKLDPNAPLNPRIGGSEFDFYGGQTAANGGRIGYEEAGAVMTEEDMEKMAKSPLYKGFKTMYGVSPDMARDNKEYEGKFKQFEQLFKKGYQEGGDVEPVAKKTLPLLDMGGKEKDYRETGGFVDMGRMEKADDVPARLSKNEFVFTADAVRNAGEGDIDKGAEVMYNMMKNLEAGGEVSEESQGLEGARKMFQTSQRLGEVI